MFGLRNMVKMRMTSIKTIMQVKANETERIFSAFVMSAILYRLMNLSLNEEGMNEMEFVDRRAAYAAGSVAAVGSRPPFMILFAPGLEQLFGTAVDILG
jgi:hypothetical protein